VLLNELSEKYLSKKDSPKEPRTDISAVVVVLLISAENITEHRTSVMNRFMFHAPQDACQQFYVKRETHQKGPETP